MNTNHGCPFVARTRHTVGGYSSAIFKEWVYADKTYYPKYHEREVNGRLKSTITNKAKLDRTLKLDMYQTRVWFGGSI